MKTREIKPLFWIVAMLCSVALIGLGGSPALAEDIQPNSPEILSGGTVEIFEGEMPAEADESFGRSTQATWFGSWLFSPTYSGEVWSSNFQNQRYSTSGSGIYYAPVKLPSGARVSRVTYYFYDSSGSDNINMKFGYSTSPTGNTTLHSSTPNVSGAYWYLDWNTSYTIANGGRWYWLCFDTWAPAGSAHRFWAVKILWNRQIRTGLPNPFIDIGGQSLDFQNSIKAMAASGITQGCGGPYYCPNDYVTRAQFAAFFARALGLYWAYPTY